MGDPARKSQRNLNPPGYRLDYKKLNNTGERLLKLGVRADSGEEQLPPLPSADIDHTKANEQLIPSTSDIAALLGSLSISTSSPQQKVMTSEVSKLQNKISSVVDDINDHLDENVIDNNLVVVADIDSCIKKAEGLRTYY